MNVRSEQYFVVNQENIKEKFFVRFGSVAYLADQLMGQPNRSLQRLTVGDLISDSRIELEIIRLLTTKTDNLRRS